MQGLVQKTNPLEFKQKHPKKHHSSHLKVQPRRRNPSVWRGQVCSHGGPAPLWKQMSIRGRGEEGAMGVGREWQADSNLSWCSVFPHYSVAYQTGLENCRGRKGSIIRRQHGKVHNKV